MPRLDAGSELKAQLVTLNYWFTGFFIMEMLLKIVAYGFAFTPKAYLKQGWNILDFGAAGAGLRRPRRASERLRRRSGVHRSGLRLQMAQWRQTGRGPQAGRMALSTRGGATGCGT